MVKIEAFYYNIEYIDYLVSVDGYKQGEETYRQKT